MLKLLKIANFLFLEMGITSFQQAQVKRRFHATFHQNFPTYLTQYL